MARRNLQGLNVTLMIDNYANLYWFTFWRVVDGSRYACFFIFIYLFLFHLLFQTTKITIILLLSQSIQAQTDYTPKHTCNSTITHKVCLLFYYKCYSRKKKLIILVKEENQLDYKVHLSINFCKLLFLVQIYFSISYLLFTVTIKLFMVGSTSLRLQLHKYIFPISIR